MSKKRDPRVNPMVGDELVIFRGGTVRWWRKVVGEYNGVRYITNSGKQNWMPRHRWEEQMRNAQVLKQARIER